MFERTKKKFLNLLSHQNKDVNCKLLLHYPDKSQKEENFVKLEEKEEREEKLKQSWTGSCKAEWFQSRYPQLLRLLHTFSSVSSEAGLSTHENLTYIFTLCSCNRILIKSGLAMRPKHQVWLAECAAALRLSLTQAATAGPALPSHALWGKPGSHHLLMALVFWGGARAAPAFHVPCFWLLLKICHKGDRIPE